MKKLLTLLTMALIAISANAQTVIGEIDWSKEEAFNNWCSGENVQRVWRSMFLPLVRTTGILRLLS